jgi:hypothetical protein
VSEKLIVFFHDANDRFGLEDGFVLHARGEYFEELSDRYEGHAARYPVQESVPAGCPIMVWEGERCHGDKWDADDDPFYRGAWRAATADDLIKAGLLEGTT